MTPILVFVAFCGLLVRAIPVTETECYYPNGDRWDAHQPCATDSDDGHTFCCDSAEQVCLSNKLCFNWNDMSITTQSCTDQNWDSGNCPDTCETFERERSAELFPVNTTNRAWCCDGIESLGEEPNCTGDSVYLGPGMIINTFGRTNDSSTGVLSDDGLNSTSAPTLNGQPDSRTSVATGLGIGLPLLLITLTLGFMLWRKRRSTPPIFGANVADSNSPGISDHHVSEIDATNKPGELHDPTHVRELYSKQRPAEISELNAQ